MNKSDYYSPFSSQQDLWGAAEKLSDMWKGWLGLGQSKKKQIVEIDPLLSIEGENL